MKQEEALEILKMGHNVFLTGVVGSGKTFLLNKYIDYLKNKGKGVAENTIIGHLEKIIEQDASVKLEHLFGDFLNGDCLDRIGKAFAKSDDWKLAPVRAIFGEEFSYDELRLARLLLRSQNF